MPVGRNDLCDCGSGKKHKRCCAVKKTSDQRVRTAIFAVLLVLVAGVVVAALVERFKTYDPEVAEGKVWCDTHQVFHDAPQQQ